MPRKKRKVRKIGFRGAATAVLRHVADRQYIRSAIKRTTKDVVEDHDIVSEIFPWTHMTLAMEFWRRLNGVSRKDFKKKRTAEWISIHNSQLSLGDFMLERDIGMDEPHKRVQGMRLNMKEVKRLWPKEKSVAFRRAMVELDAALQAKVEGAIRSVTPKEERANEAINCIKAARKAGFKSYELEKEYGWDTSVKQYNEILRKKVYDIGFNFLKAASIVHGIDGEESDKVNHALAGLMMFAMAYDDLNDLKEDYKTQPNMIVSLARENKEIKALEHGLNGSKFPHGKLRLVWIERNMPKTYNDFMVHVNKQRMLAREFFTDKMMTRYSKYVMSKPLKKLRMR
jgi:hypothetical protein